MQLRTQLGVEVELVDGTVLDVGDAPDVGHDAADVLLVDVAVDARQVAVEVDELRRRHRRAAVGVVAQHVAQHLHRLAQALRHEFIHCIGSHSSFIPSHTFMVRFSLVTCFA